MTALHAHSIKFELIQPLCCGTTFLMSSSQYNARAKDKKVWWCPNCGDTRIFPGETEEDKLQRRLTFEKQRRTEAEREAEYHRNSARAQKAAKTRIKNRIANGVCPCCNRTFKQLAAHMCRMHPDFKQKLILSNVKK